MCFASVALQFHGKFIYETSTANCRATYFTSMLGEANMYAESVLGCVVSKYSIARNATPALPLFSFLPLPFSFV